MTSYLLLLLLLLLLSVGCFPYGNFARHQGISPLFLSYLHKKEVKASPDSNAKKAPPQD